MRRVLVSFLVAALPTAAIAQAPPMEDVLWLTANSGQVHAIDQAGRAVRSLNAGIVWPVHRAPDGTLWSRSHVELVQLDRLGAQLRRIPFSGVAHSIAIDAAGDIWVSFTFLAPRLQRFAPDGTLRSSHNLLASPLAMAIGADGTVWVAMSNQPSSLIALVDPANGSIRNFTLPGSFGAVRCVTTTPYGSALIGAERSGRILEIDARQTVLRTIDTGRTQVQRIALRPQGDALVIADGQLLRIDPTTGSITEWLTPTRPPLVEDLGQDARGGIWVAWPDRIERFDPITRRVDSAPISLFQPTIQDGGGHHRALVVAQQADDDRDGITNAVELQLGTSPYDAQSSGLASIRTERVTWRPGDALSFELRGTGGQGVTLLATDTLAGQPPLPGFAGAFRLDPAATLGIVFPTLVPSRLTLRVPDDPALDGAFLFAQSVVGLLPPRLTEAAGVRIEQAPLQSVTESFDRSSRLDHARSSGTWANGSASPGAIGSLGELGDFDHRLGQDLGNGVWLWSTDDQLIPAAVTLDGVARRVTDGRFDFARFDVPAGVTVRFRGSNPAVIRIAGTCAIDGTLDLAADLVVGDHNGKNATLSGSVVIPGPGQAGGTPGAGGGRGGDGGWSCDGSGNPNQAQFNGFAGYHGEDVQVLPGHAYAGNVGGTGGRGSPLFPAHGDQAQLVFGALSSNYALECGGGGGGAGFRVGGAIGVCTYAGAISGFPPFPNPTPAHRGPGGLGGNAFVLQPLPAGTTSLEHFLVGGAGGGGGGSHAVFALQFGGNDLAKYRSGGGGAGGGGAVALRVGGSLSVGGSGLLAATGGSAEPSATTTSQGQRGVPCPGGGGSGGSVLLQVAGAVSQAGSIDVLGGSGSHVAFTGFFLLDTQGGDGAPGSIRLEVPLPSPPVSLLGATLPAAGPNDVGTLRDRDSAVGQLSTLYAVPVSTRLLHYELDVRVNGVLLTFRDDPARFMPANQPGQPVRIRFQGASAAGTLGPWRDFVHASLPGIAADLPSSFRFQLSFDRSQTSTVVVEELRVLAR